MALCELKLSHVVCDQLSVLMHTSTCLHINIDLSTLTLGQAVTAKQYILVQYSPVQHKNHLGVFANRSEKNHKQMNGSVKEPNKFHIYETEKITRKASDVAEYIELFGSFTRDRHARRI